MSDKIKKAILGEARILLISLGAGLILTLVFALVTRLYANEAQEDIASEILRFHVLAHSDGEADQALKLLVRDAVLAEYSEALSNVDDRYSSIEFIRFELDNIESIAAGVVAEAGLDHSVRAGLTNQFFPTRAYGDLRLPPGMYGALTIRIGDAIGENWWCVIFPPRCFVDEAQTELSQSSRNQFAELLSDSAYELISQSKNTDRVRVRFALVEWWQIYVAYRYGSRCNTRHNRPFPWWIGGLLWRQS